MAYANRRRTPLIRGTASRKWEPADGKVTFSFVHNDKFYVRVSCALQARYRGGPEPEYSEEQLLPLQQFDFSSAQWSDVSPLCADREPEEQRFWTEFTRLRRHYVGMCCAVLGDCAYTYGGDWQYGYAVHELNLETMVWRRLKAKNRHDVNHPVNVWTNKLHSFHIKTSKSWLGGMLQVYRP